MEDKRTDYGTMITLINKAGNYYYYNIINYFHST